MRDKIPTAVICDLQRLGLTPVTVDVETVKTRLLPFDWINRQHWEAWDSITEEMEHDQLVMLAKGLVRSEKLLRWSGGSVAAAIWVFRVFQRRFPQEANSVAEWMLANSDNPWVPFGSNRGDARSLADVESARTAKNARRRSSEENAELQRHLRQVKKRVRERIACEHRTVQAGISSARKQLLEKLDSLSLRERIEHLAWDNLHPLNFYPIELAKGSIQEMCQVDAVSLRRLALKAMARKRGPWRTWAVGLRKDYI